MAATTPLPATVATFNARLDAYGNVIDLPPAKAAEREREFTIDRADALAPASAAAGAAAPAASPAPVMSIVYCPGGVLPKLTAYIGKTIEVRIAARFLTTRNKEVVTRQIWGTDVYTDDSDAVAILLHTGQIVLRATPPGTSVAAIFKVLPPLTRVTAAAAGADADADVDADAADANAAALAAAVDPSNGSGDAATAAAVAALPAVRAALTVGVYPSTTRYTIRSRQWASPYPRTSLQLLRVDRVDNAFITSVYPIQPTTVRPRAAAAAAAAASALVDDGAFSSALISADKQKEVKLHKMSEKAGAGSSDYKFQAAQARNKRKMPHATIVYNSTHDPCLRYALNLVVDRNGYVDESDWTSTRLKREVLYFEKFDSPVPLRYELAREQDSEHKFDSYRWSQVVSSPWANFELPITSGAAAAVAFAAATAAAASGSSANGKRQKSEALVPKKESDVRVIERGVDWDQIEWGPTGVRIRGKSYTLNTLQWTAIYPPPPAPSPVASAAAAAGAGAGSTLALPVGSPTPSGSPMAPNPSPSPTSSSTASSPAGNGAAAAASVALSDD